MCKFAMEHLERTRGVIINMASVNAYWAEPDLAVYSASKAAVLQLTRCIALDHAAAGVRSVAICPGYVRTEMLEHYYQSQLDPPSGPRRPDQPTSTQAALRAGRGRLPRILARLRRSRLRLRPALHPRRSTHHRTFIPLERQVAF
jgi:NAD(P)-dependent dehydrogenase (short-subunit alcohol dehydrogenase family)